MALAVLHSPAEWRERFGGDSRAVLTIGNFDGVHLGHQKILHRVLKRARASGHLAAAITFSPHPVRVLRPDSAPPLIETLEQRLARIEELGLDAALILHFDREMAALAPEEFVRRILCDSLRASAVVIGETFRFGHRQAGNAGTLVALGRTQGFEVEPISPVVIRGVAVSSSQIRRAIHEGRVSRAARLLGRPFSLAGEIQSGTATGRNVLFPTLNLATTQELLPGRGVYVTETVVEGGAYRSATNVGFRPTFDGTRLTIESHLFDFSREITAGRMEIRFCRRLRDERKFSDVSELFEQIQRDFSRARLFFARLDAARRLARTQ
jgi:riboflavin kinase / FMN adenylyltransferase